MYQIIVYRAIGGPDSRQMVATLIEKNTFVEIEAVCAAIDKQNAYQFGISVLKLYLDNLL